MSLIDELQVELKDYFNVTSKTPNYLKIYDTPNIWGMKFDSSVLPAAIKRDESLAAAMGDVIKQVVYRLDISTLNAPDATWRQVLLSAIDKAMSTKQGRTEAPQIRILLSVTPSVFLTGIFSYFTGAPDYNALKDEIAQLIKSRSKDWESIPEIWIGRFYRLFSGIGELDLSVNLNEEDIKKALTGDEKTLKKINALNDSDMEKLEEYADKVTKHMTWNHSKIIAVDGFECVAGGHNFNSNITRHYPPYHDVSVKVKGDSAYAAQQYLDKMWQAGKDLLTKEYFDADKKVWVNADDKPKLPVDPLVTTAAKKYMQEKQVITLTPDEKKHYTQAGRILAVGKYWTGPNMETDYQKGSQIMKEYVIKNAKKIIRMSQQDIISAWKKNWKDHEVAQWIIEALLANPELQVQIVVSPLNAAAGIAGFPFSFGSGAQRTFELFQYYLTHNPDTDTLIADPDGLRKNALRRLKIAPFYFTDQVPSTSVKEGETYYWPNVDKADYAATLRAPDLSTKPPKKGVIGHVVKTLLQGSGLFFPKVPPAPGNHAKVTIIDDEIYIVGSDNMYPGYLSEFDYIVEGSEAVNAFIAAYWQPLWKYSSVHSVTYHEV